MASQYRKCSPSAPKLRTNVFLIALVSLFSSQLVTAAFKPSPTRLFLHETFSVLPSNNQIIATVSTSCPRTSWSFQKPNNALITHSFSKHGTLLLSASSDVDGGEVGTSNDDGDSSATKTLLTHADVLWKLCPPKGATKGQRLKTKIAANLIRLDCALRRQQAPLFLCPKGGQAMIEAHVVKDGNRVFRKKKRTKVARFGISTQRGPPLAQLDDTVRDVYNIEPPRGVGAGAIIYMFVEPKYRGSGIGELALELISAIHAVQGCDFTILVADDNGSGKLVDWYEARGFSLAPKLQDVMGSPGGKFGTAMIAPVSVDQGFLDTCCVKWW